MCTPTEASVKLHMFARATTVLTRFSDMHSLAALTLLAVALSAASAADFVTTPTGRKLTFEEVQRINTDGEAVHPEAMMKWLKLDENQRMREGIAKKDPELIRTIEANDVDGFQAKMRALNKANSARNEDGSSPMPEEFMKHLQAEAKHFNMKAADPEMYKVVSKGDVAGMQALLRKRHAEKVGHERQERAHDERPRTPYDAMGSVDMSFRVQKDDGTEVDMVSLRPEESEEEKTGGRLPVRMACAACAAFTHQLALRLPEAYAANDKRKADPKKRRGGGASTDGLWRKPLAQVTAEAIEEVCADRATWQSEYGLEPGRGGHNLLTGPGVPRAADSLHGDQGVMVQQQHGGRTAHFLAAACHEQMSDLAPDDDDDDGDGEEVVGRIVTQITNARAVDDAESAALPLFDLLCPRRCLLYNEYQREVGAAAEDAAAAGKKKKKKRKQKNKAPKSEL